MKPTIGRVVIFTTTEEQKVKMKVDGCNVQDKLPATIVSVHGEECVNLKVQLDGPGEMWVTSALKGDAPYQWEWPVIER